MYHLFVSGNDGAWLGEPYEMELPRVLREYTAAPITEKYGALSEEALEALKGFRRCSPTRMCIISRQK